MMTSLSIFTGSTDIEQALGLVFRTAAGEPRAADNSLSLDIIQERFITAEGVALLLNMASRFEVPLDLDLEQLRQLVADEILSSRALKAHRGRNVYSAGKLALWEKLWAPFIPALMPKTETLTLLDSLISMKTQPGGEDIDDCVILLNETLEHLSFDVKIFRKSGHAPLILAHREAQGLPGRVIMYNHYDVENPEVEAWHTDPWQMTEQNGRLFGVGIGDNKAALSIRLIALEEITETPELLWVIQGEEEIGSPLGHELLPDLLGQKTATLWLEENGYFEVDGTQRVLARNIGTLPDSSASPDEALLQLLDTLGQCLHPHQLGWHMECCGLNKSFAPRGCPFNLAMKQGQRYLAIGVIDPLSNIHGPNESVAMWPFPIHRQQFEATLAWVGEYASHE